MANSVVDWSGLHALLASRLIALKMQTSNIGEEELWGR